MCPEAAPANDDGLEIELDDDEDWEDEEQNEWDEWAEGKKDNSTQEEKEDDRRTASGRTAD